MELKHQLTPSDFVELYLIYIWYYFAINTGDIACNFKDEARIISTNVLARFIPRNVIMSNLRDEITYL